MTTINSRIHPILKERFHELLSNPLFAHVCYKNNGKFTSYHMFEYSEEWAKFARVVDKKLEEKTGENIFTRKYNKNLLAQLQKIVDGIAAEDVIHSTERFKTWMDL